MADQRILYSERMVGAGHPTLPDTLNRITLVEHNTDGTHKMDIIQLASDSVNGIMSSTDKAKLDDIDLAGAGVGQPFIKFDLGATGAPIIEGTVNWNNTENCLEFKTGMGNVVQIGKELGDSGINKTGGTATDGKVVYASGAQGKKFEFMYADAREASKCAFVGIVTYNTANNAEGPVTSYGTVNNLNTSSWPEGTKLYIAADATGDLTNVAPSSPNFRVWVATVTYSHISDGSIFVDPKLDYTNGITLTSVDVITSANLPTSTTIGSVNASEIGYLDGVTSSIQAQFNGKENISTKGQALGYCPLDGSAKVAEAYLPDSVLGQVDYKGTWNATTNVPVIPAASTANKGWYYIVATSGTTTINGISEWTIGDWIISNGTTWNKIDNTDSVSSVFGRAGAIIANSGDYTASQITNVPAGNISVTTVQAALNELDSEKQATLVSGTNIKTVNGTTLLGSGDIIISVAVSDGDKGDITVSDSGATWTVDVKDPYAFFKSDAAAVAFTKTGAATASVKAGTRVMVGTTLVNFDTSTAITMPTLTGGTDYAIYACADGTCRADASFTAPTGYTTGNSRMIGGFHYGLVAAGTTVAGGSFATTGNGMIWTQADVDKIAGINQYSLWDLKWRPQCDPKGMALVAGRVWVDIYFCGTNHTTNGTSKAGTDIASGTVLPKKPLEFGGNGTTTYDSPKWWDFAEIVAAYKKRMLTEEEFTFAAFGVTENQSIDDVSSTYPTTQRNAGYTSKYGIEQATGHHWTWGKGNAGAAATAYAANGGRGQSYNNLSTAPLFGGKRTNGVFSGSRCAAWNYPPSYTYWYIGVRAACDHLVLV